MTRSETAPMQALLVATLVAVGAVAGCGRQTQEQPGRIEGRTQDASGRAIDQRIGWLNRACLAIEDRALAAGTPLTMVVLDDGQSIVESRIVSPADAGERCPALAEDRRAANTGAGLSFYQVAAPQGRKLGLAIGVIGPTARVGTGLDVDGDGKAEQFSQCATSEGVSFGVWKGPAYTGTPLWSGYYYLGYDTESTCPP